MKKEKLKIVVWKDGTYKIVNDGITWEYESDKDWLVTIDLKEKEIVECQTCNTLKESSPTPDGDEICPSCGDREMLDKE